jgi:diacylglycerol kinase family enzyme
VDVTLIHNPGAGDEAHSLENLLRELGRAGYEVRHQSTKKNGLDEALDDPGELVIVAGGDGSIKRVALALVGREVPMAILPIGTANNIARSLGALGSVNELINGWRTAERRKLSVGTAVSRWGTMSFVESVGVGVFTELISRGNTEVDDNTAGLTGHALDRALLLLQSIVAERPAKPRQIEVDGKDRSGDYVLIEIMNMPLVGPNVPLAPKADYSDDQLEVVTVTEKERSILADYVKARLAGVAAPPKLPVRRARRVVLRASPVQLHVDDEGWKPVRAEGEGPDPNKIEGELTIALDGGSVEVLVVKRESAG